MSAIDGPERACHTVISSKKNHGGIIDMLTFFPSIERHSIIRILLLMAAIGGFGAMRVQAQTNLALHKPAQQSSTYDSGFAAVDCVDGGKTISGAYRQGGTFGPSVGGIK
jgi:hypothetical protein